MYVGRRSRRLVVFSLHSQGSVRWTGSFFFTASTSPKATQPPQKKKHHENHTRETTATSTTAPKRQTHLINSRHWRPRGIIFLPPDPFRSTSSPPLFCVRFFPLPAAALLLLLDRREIEVLAYGGVLLVVEVSLQRGVEADEVETEVRKLEANYLEAAREQHGVLPVVVRRHLRMCVFEVTIANKNGGKEVETREQSTTSERGKEKKLRRKG